MTNNESYIFNFQIVKIIVADSHIVQIIGCQYRIILKIIPIDEDKLIVDSTIKLVENEEIRYVLICVFQEK